MVRLSKIFFLVKTLTKSEQWKVSSMENKQTLIRALKQYTNGAMVIKAAEFARFLGVSHQVAKSKLAGLPAFEGKYYLLNDVADLMIRGLEG